MSPKSARLILLVLLLLVLATAVAHATYGYCDWCHQAFEIGVLVKYLPNGDVVHSDCYGDYIYYWYGGDPPWQQDPVDVPWGG